MAYRPSIALVAAALAALLLASACGSDVTTEDGGNGGSAGASSTTSSTSSGSGGQGAGAQGGGGAVGGSGGGSGEVLCNPGLVACYAPTPACPPGEVPSVVDECWGSCVPIMTCATEPNCDSCTTGFCAAYEAWTTEYRCVMPSLQCSALACSCLAPYFCVDAFDACIDAPSTGGADVRCTCPAC